MSADGEQGGYGEFHLVSGKRPPGLSDDEIIMTHEVTRGWGSRPFIRKVSDIDWQPVFGIRRSVLAALSGPIHETECWSTKG